MTIDHQLHPLPLAFNLLYLSLALSTVPSVYIKNLWHMLNIFTVRVQDCCANLEVEVLFQGQNLSFKCTNVWAQYEEKKMKNEKEWLNGEMGRKGENRNVSSQGSQNTLARVLVRKIHQKINFNNELDAPWDGWSNHGYFKSRIHPTRNAFHDPTGASISCNNITKTHRQLEVSLYENDL